MKFLADFNAEASSSSRTRCTTRPTFRFLSPMSGARVDQNNCHNNTGVTILKNWRIIITVFSDKRNVWGREPFGIAIFICICSIFLLMY